MGTISESKKQLNDSDQKLKLLNDCNNNSQRTNNNNDDSGDDDDDDDSDGDDVGSGSGVDGDRKAMKVLLADRFECKRKNGGVKNE
uniref:Uncharacterized protein n=1 Tax=Syphacia muris TaxID=451379 RepID=A0A0N5AGG7_9BILA